MPGHWYFTFIPSSWEDRAKPGFLILLFRGHGKWFGAVVECWRIPVVTIHPQWGSWGSLFIIQTVRHFQLQPISQLLTPPRLQDFSTGGHCPWEGSGLASAPTDSVLGTPAATRCKDSAALSWGKPLHLAHPRTGPRCCHQQEWTSFCSNTSDSHTLGLDLSPSLLRFYRPTAQNPQV